ncbi:MAG: hypothetical protein M0Q14_08475 [Tissierellaceae bacterium]|nr:hypothetical protein [Tissierellaceae bacterium]
MSTEILAFLSPIASALIIWYVQYHNIKRDKQRDLEQEEEKRKQELKEKERDKESKERAEARKQENLLTMRMIKAVGKLSYANSVAIKEGKVNGVMEEALIYYRDASNEMTEFLQEQAVEHYIK